MSASTKVCTRCKVEKELSCFSPHRRMTKKGIKAYIHGHCKPCRVAYNRPYRNVRASTLASIKSKLKKKYGITPEQRAAQMQEQNHQCAVCKTDLTKLSPQTVHIDHCHATGKLRGILCGSCNTALGHLKDSVPILQNAITYLLTQGVWK